LKFEEFGIGQSFVTNLVINEEEFRKYILFPKTRNILFENTALAIKEGVSGIFLSGRAILARAEGKMTRLKEFSENTILLYGMDGDPDRENRHTRFLAEVYLNDILQVKYSIGDKKNLLTRNMEYCLLT
jgi:hypothetical protein